MVKFKLDRHRLIKRKLIFSFETDFSELITSGGLNSGELGIILAPHSVGKSTNIFKKIKEWEKGT